MEKCDKLDEIFRLQKELNQRIGVDTDRMTEAERPEWVLKYCLAMRQEVAELTDCLPWKWWAKYQRFDRQNARVEVVDLLHFLVSVAQVLEIGPEEIFEAYTKKHRVNLDRQESGYSTKDERDNRDI